MATPLYNNNTDPIIIPDNLLFYHIPMPVPGASQCQAANAKAALQGRALTFIRQAQLA
jgi:hypothetical protein